MQQTTVQTNPMSSSSPSSSPIIERRKKVLKNLGMTITIITSFIILLGITLPVYGGIQMRHHRNNGRHYVVLPTIGEGIWASVIPLVAGILAIKAAAPGFNKCLLQAYLALAIIGAFGQFVLMCIEISYCLVSAVFGTGPFTAMLAINAILSFVNFVLLIVSSSYTCLLMPGCCNDDEQILQQNQGQVVYVASGAHVAMQQPGTVAQQQGMVPQQPGMTHQQPGMAHQQPGMAPQQPGMVYQQPGMAPQQPGMAHQQPGMVYQQPGMAHQQPGMAHQQPGMAHQQPGMVLQQPGMVPQQPGMVPQQAQPYPQKPGYPDQPPSYQ